MAMKHRSAGWLLERLRRLHVLYANGRFVGRGWQQITMKQCQVLQELKQRGIEINWYQFTRGGGTMALHGTQMVYESYLDENGNEYPEDYDGEDETHFLACPECGSPGDYCPSVHHWECDDCGELLTENPNNDTWECWNNECAVNNQPEGGNNATFNHQ